MDTLASWNANNWFRKALEVGRQSENGLVGSLQKAEAEASRTLATEAALKPVQKPTSWWPSTNLWTKELKNPLEKDAPNDSQDKPKGAS